jgi:sec-independent protein translocase protein TatA
MDFFGMGMGEILLILLVALIIWGPGRITEVGRTMGKVARTLKKATFDLTTQITRETEQQEKKLPPQEKKDEASGEQGTRVSEQ